VVPLQKLDDELEAEQDKVSPALVVKWATDMDVAPASSIIPTVGMLEGNRTGAHVERGSREYGVVEVMG
jgi:hypothetical protein